MLLPRRFHVSSIWTDVLALMVTQGQFQNRLSLRTSPVFEAHTFSSVISDLSYK